MGSKYNDFLDTNFDGSVKQLNPLAQIYLTSQSNNEICNLKGLIQQVDKEHFKDAMHKEVD